MLLIFLLLTLTNLSQLRNYKLPILNNGLEAPESWPPPEALAHKVLRHLTSVSLLSLTSYYPAPPASTFEPSQPTKTMTGTNLCLKTKRGVLFMWQQITTISA